MARLRWLSPLADGGHGFAPWLRDLRGGGHNGVYLIRDAGSGNIQYIGESHTARLYETLTRHLYAWNGKGAGPSYDPATVEIAVILAETPLDDPVVDQYALIQHFNPPDNVMDGHTLLWRTGFGWKNGAQL